MTRREFVALVATAAAFQPLVAAAQGPAKQYRIAFVHSGIPANQLTETAGPFWVRRFFEALRALGYVEEWNLLVERYSAEGYYDRFPALAYQVVARNPDVIVANSNELVQAFREATTTIPILGIVGDPVQSGLVKSLARPGGNVTGVSIDAGIEVYGKQLQILKEAIPSVAKVAFLTSRGTWDGTAGRELRKAGERLGVSLTGILPPEVNPAQLRRAFAEIAQQGLDAVVVGGEGTFLANRGVIVELAGEYRVAAQYPYRDYVEQGGLMAYAPDLGELAQRLADDVHRILHGAKPGDLPVYQPTKFELVINLKTAEALGLTLPPSILGRADEVIE
jgi:putative tryptophan/tyrosine transport system substrate-binding protein